LLDDHGTYREINKSFLLRENMRTPMMKDKAD